MLVQRRAIRRLRPRFGSCGSRFEVVGQMRRRDSWRKIAFTPAILKWPVNDSYPFCRLNGLCEHGAYGKNGQERNRAKGSEGPSPPLRALGGYAAMESSREGGRRSGSEQRLG